MMHALLTRTAQQPSIIAYVKQGFVNVEWDIMKTPITLVQSERLVTQLALSSKTVQLLSTTVIVSIKLVPA